MSQLEKKYYSIELNKETKTITIILELFYNFYHCSYKVILLTERYNYSVFVASKNSFFVMLIQHTQLAIVPRGTTCKICTEETAIVINDHRMFVHKF